MQVLIRISSRLRDRLRAVSEDVDIGMNVIVTRAIEDYLDRLEAGERDARVAD